MSIFTVIIAANVHGQNEKLSMNDGGSTRLLVENSVERITEELLMEKIFSAGTQVVIFYDPHFPGACSRQSRDGIIPVTELSSARYVDAASLATALTDDITLFISFHGSYFPKAAWTAILRFCERGGNLAVLGGAPFISPVRDDGTVEPQTMAYSGTLYLGPATALDLPRGPISLQPADEALFLATTPLRLTAAAPGRFWAMRPMLTQSVDHPHEHGSSGPLDTRLVPLVYALHDTTGERVATPFYMLHQQSGRFAGGCWLIAGWQPSCDEDWLANAAALQAMVRFIAAGCHELDTRMDWACYLPGETPSLVLRFRSPRGLQATITLTAPDADAAVTLFAGELPPSDAMAERRLSLPVCEQPGLYQLRCCYTTPTQQTMQQDNGFWVWDERLVAQTHDQRLTAGRDFFQQQGRPVPIFGTTYMDSVVQRHYLALPNPARWDADFAAMRATGINTVRTGIWTDWEALAPLHGEPSEQALRALDAFIMTASRYEMQVIFTFFAFFPPYFGGSNPWLDPHSLAYQEAFVALLAQRYRDVALLSWDLINEPSFGHPDHIFSKRPIPNGDAFERAAFRDWLRQRYTLDDLQTRWQMTPAELPDWEAITPPEADDFRTSHIDLTPRRPLRASDFTHFSQTVIAHWATHLTNVIRATGNHQLVGIGQDEAEARPSPQFYAGAVDYTTTHPWWNNNDLLWDMVLDKTPTRPNLSQEVGVMLVRDFDGQPFRSEHGSAHLLERKLFMSVIARGAGIIQWLWHTNAYMLDENENSIGLVRADGSGKPELGVMREFGRFSQTYARHVRETDLPTTWLVIPYAQWFIQPAYGIRATRNAVRALGYDCGVIPQLISEYHLGHLLMAQPQPRLVIVPGVQFLSSDAWLALQHYLRAGGHVLLSGLIPAHLTTSSQWPVAEFAPSPVGHYETLTWQHHTFPLTFATEDLGLLRKAHTQVLTLPEGEGILTWIGLPIELADSPETLSAIYHLALPNHLAPAYPPGVLVSEQELDGCTLFLVVSEANETHTLTLAPHLTITIAPQRAGAIFLPSDGPPTCFGGCRFAREEERA